MKDQRPTYEQLHMEERLIELNRELEKTNKNLQAAYQWMRDSRDLQKQYRYEEDISCLVDRSGRIEWISEAALSFTGKSRLALIDGNLPELLHDDSREEFRKAMHQAWMGAAFPLSTRFAVNGSADAIMEVKMTRLTSRETRRLWVLFQHPMGRAANVIGV